MPTITSNRRIVSVVDQGLLAGGNMVATVLFARWLPVEDFAVVAAMLSIWVFFEAVQRIGILALYIGEVPTIEENKADHTLWFYVNILILAGAVVVLTVLGFVLPSFAAKSAYLAAFLVPFAGLFFYGKRLLYHAGRPLVALGTSCLNVGSLSVGLAAIWLGLLPRDASAVALTYGAGFFVAAAVAFICLRRTFAHPTNTANALRFRISLIFKMSLGALAGCVYNNGIQFLLVLYAPFTEAAAFAATRVLVRPVNLISQAITDVELSTASRIYCQDGNHALNAFLRRIMLRMTVLLGPIGIILVFYTPEFIALLFDGKYDAFNNVGQAWLLALIPQIASLTLNMRFSVQARVNTLLLARGLGAMTCLFLFFALLFLHDTITALGGVLCVLVGRSTVTLVLWVNRS